jgi:hypothetical protein
VCQCDDSHNISLSDISAAVVAALLTMKEMGWLPKLQAAASALLVFISCMSGHAQGRWLCVTRPVEETAHCGALMRGAMFYSRKSSL